jgi:hypothetical protein
MLLSSSHSDAAEDSSFFAVLRCLVGRAVSDVSKDRRFIVYRIKQSHIPQDFFSK